MATVNNGLHLTGNGSGNFMAYNPSSGTGYASNAVTISAVVTFTGTTSTQRAGLMASSNNGNSDESFIGVQSATGNGTTNYGMSLLNESVAWGNNSPANQWTLNTPYWLQETWNPSTNVLTGKLYAISNGVIGASPIVNLSYTGGPKSVGLAGFYLTSGASMTVAYTLIQGTGTGLSPITVGGVFGSVPTTTTMAIASGAALTSMAPGRPWPDWRA